MVNNKNAVLIATSGRRNENCAGAAVFYPQYTSSCVNVNTRSVGIINSQKSNQEV